MTNPIQCPECNGTGCDPEPLEAPADGTVYLFPRCALCRGRGNLTAAQHQEFIRRKKRRATTD